MTNFKVITLSLAFLLFSSIALAAGSGRAMRTVSPEVLERHAVIQAETTQQTNQETFQSQETVHPLGVLFLILGVGSVFLFPVVTELVTKKVIDQHIAHS